MIENVFNILFFHIPSQRSNQFIYFRLSEKIFTLPLFLPQKIHIQIDVVIHLFSSRFFVIDYDAIFVIGLSSFSAL